MGLPQTGETRACTELQFPDKSDKTRPIRLLFVNVCVNHFITLVIGHWLYFISVALLPHDLFTFKHDWLLLGGQQVERAFLLVNFTPPILHYSRQLEGEIPVRWLKRQYLQLCLYSAITSSLISPACRRFSAKFLKLFLLPFSN